MFGWYKVKKYFPAGTLAAEPWDRAFEQDGLQWSDPEEYRKQLFYPLLVKYLEKGKKYVDAGCGMGGWLAFLRARGYEITGVEASKKAVAMAQRIDPTLQIQQSSILHLPFKNESLDGYIAVGVWEFYEDATDAVAAEAARVLKPEGILLIEVPYANPLRRWTYLPLKSAQVWWNENMRGMKSIFVQHLFRKGDIREVLIKQGFTIIEENPHELPDRASHYGLWVDWPFLRGRRPYELNALGQLIKTVMSGLSPWMIATGIFLVAKKQ